MSGVENAGSVCPDAQAIIKDATGAQLITKTLEKMNTAVTLTGPRIDADYQLRKDMLHAAGIAKTLDAVV